MSKILLLVLILAIVTQQKGLTKKQLEQTLLEYNSSPFVSLLLVFDSNAPNTNQMLAVMANIAEKRKGYFNVVLVDCNTDDQEVIEGFIYCNDQYRKALPALVFSEPNLNRQSNSQDKSLSSVKPYQGPLDDKSLFNFAAPLMRTYSVQLKTSRDFKKFEQSYKDLPKVVYFTDKQKIPPLFRALTASFRDTIVFGHVFSKSQLAKDLNVTKFPIFLLNGKQKIEVKPNLTELIERFDVIKGEPTNIYIQEYTQSNAELTASNLQQLVYKAPEHILIHVVGADGNEHPEWANIGKKFSKMFKFYQTFTLKQTLGVKQTPAIVYFPKSLAKKSVQKTIFTPRDNYDTIYSQLDSMIEDFTVPISNFLQLQKMTSIHLHDDKFVALYFHSKQIPLTYKVISNDPELQEDIAFFRMKDPERDVLQQYQIKKLPSLIVMMADKENQKPPTEKQLKQGKVGMQLKLAAYQGKFSYSELSSFFKSFSSKKQQVTNTQESYEQEEGTGKVEQIKRANKLKNKCEEGCYLLFLNGNKDNEAKNKNYLNIVEKEASRIMGGSFGYVDGVCHPELTSVFDIQQDDLPAFVHVETKFQRYSRMIGRVQSNSVGNFLGKVKLRKAVYRGYNKLEFVNKDCQAEHERLKKLSESSSVIDQDEAAILEQIKAEEQKKREQFEKAQKGQKIRKKNKKRRPKAEEQQEQL